MVDEVKGLLVCCPCHAKLLLLLLLVVAAVVAVVVVAVVVAVVHVVPNLTDVDFVRSILPCTVLLLLSLLL